ncbi:MAG: phenylalanyl-tRNA synthetase beta chain [Candidatus Woesearchaeota archaeon]|nr:phenylalanyl-tRNA synthetase beta chain [Candidatus Woesearchaeota archaeon]
MPTIEINKGQLYELVGEKIEDDKLTESLSSLGMSVEGKDDEELSIEVFPNRPDFLTVYGVARGLRYFLEKEKNIKRYSIEDYDERDNYGVIIDKSVKDVRPYTVCAIAKGLKLDDAKIKELIQIQEKLHITFGRKRKKVAIGIYPLENIKFPIRFMAERPEKIVFRPLESSEEMNAVDLLKKHPTGIKYADLLKGKSMFPCFIDASNKILSVPPIINSHDTGKITEDTKEVFIECSGFDLDYLKKGLNILAYALLDMGAKIHKMKLEYPEFVLYTPDFSEDLIEIDAKYVSKLIGIKFNEKMIEKSLLKLGIEYKEGKAYVPPYRTDILHPVDVVEDIAIGYGYDNIPSRVPLIYSKGGEDDFEIFQNKMREIVTEAGLIEVKNFNLISNEDAERFGFKALKILNPSNIEYNVLRSSLIPSLLSVFRTNKTRVFPQKVFEISKIFPSEKTTIALGISSKDADFTKIKQIVQLIGEQLDLMFNLEEDTRKFFIEGRSGKIKLDNKEIGIIGEIHPSILSDYGLEMPVAIAEINVEDLMEKKFS